MYTMNPNYQENNRITANKSIKEIIETHIHIYSIRNKAEKREMGVGKINNKDGNQAY